MLTLTCPLSEFELIHIKTVYPFLLPPNTLHLAKTAFINRKAKYLLNIKFSSYAVFIYLHSLMYVYIFTHITQVLNTYA